MIETHAHADFLSGHLEPAAVTGATVIYGAGAAVRFPHREVTDGKRPDLGQVALGILATPGHTPESICILVYEHPDDEVPYGMLTGDTLFVRDVGRPDLLASAGAGLSAPALARPLYYSLHGKLPRLPDATRVFPAHQAIIKARDAGWAPLPSDRPSRPPGPSTDHVPVRPSRIGRYVLCARLSLQYRQERRVGDLKLFELKTICTLVALCNRENRIASPLWPA